MPGRAFLRPRAGEEAELRTGQPRWNLSPLLHWAWSILEAGARLTVRKSHLFPCLASCWWGGLTRRWTGPPGAEGDLHSLSGTLSQAARPTHPFLPPTVTNAGTQQDSAASGCSSSQTGLSEQAGSILPEKSGLHLLRPPPAPAPPSTLAGLQQTLPLSEALRADPPE